MTAEEIARHLAAARISLPVHQVAALQHSAVERSLGAGEVLLREGEPSSALYIVCDGELVVSVDAGTELGRCGTGSIVGEVSLLDGEPASATLTASQPSTLLAIDRAAFDSLYHRDPQSATALLRALCLALAARVRASSDLLESLSPEGEPTPVKRASLLAVLRSLFVGAKEAT
jgi:CRP-like cAMP-binding protein